MNYCYFVHLLVQVYSNFHFASETVLSICHLHKGAHPHLTAHILCKINLAIFDVTYIFDHATAILDISVI